MGESPAAKFVRENFNPDDRLALLIIDKTVNEREMITRFKLAHDIAGESFQRWLYHVNGTECREISMCMNPIREGEWHRLERNVAEVRFVHLDIDHGGPRRLQEIAGRLDMPLPRLILETSPGRYQVAWSVDGFSPEAAKTLQYGLAREFGGDAQATDLVRGLRLPGFINNKYADRPRVTVQQFDAPAARPEQFPKFEYAHEYTEPQGKGPAACSGRNIRNEGLSKDLRQDGSPDEDRFLGRDWAWVHQQLTVEHRTAEDVQWELRAMRGPGTEQPKRYPEYYSKRTVDQAVEHLKRQGWDFSSGRETQARGR